MLILQTQATVTFLQVFKYLWVHVTHCLDFFVVFCRSLIVFLFFFFWSLYCLSIFDLRRVLDTTLCYEFSFFAECLGTGCWFSLVSSSNKTGRHDITEILLEVALNTIILFYFWSLHCLLIFDIRLLVTSLCTIFNFFSSST